jgi:ubiquinol-cytochrome c reductase cytochrome b subunit
MATDESVRIVDDPASLPPELRDTLDGRARRWFFRTWPPQRLLPDSEPIYVKSWLYTFGVAALVCLLMLVASGVVLALAGPQWWMESKVGAWFGAFHYWAVQLFFMAMVAHLVAVLLMGAFRGRALTWMLGLLSFAAAATTGLTGFVALQDFEGQWVATQAKDALNSAGAGAFLNLLDAGQVLTMHVVVLPLVVVGLVVAHLLWVRKHGICPPYDPAAADVEPADGEKR